MTLIEARKEAQSYANKHRTSLKLVHDPPGRDDWETEEEAYNYCIPGALTMLFGVAIAHGLSKEIETIKPKGRTHE